jgi:hypothetical protein
MVTLMRRLEGVCMFIVMGMLGDVFMVSLIRRP